MTRRSARLRPGGELGRTVPALVDSVLEMDEVGSPIQGLCEPRRQKRRGELALSPLLRLWWILP